MVMIEDNAFERASWDLAQSIEVFAEDIDKGVLVKACCWVLADCIVASSKAGTNSLDGALELCIRALTHCTADLAVVKPELLH
jgi:hypothetical protein